MSSNQDPPPETVAPPGTGQEIFPWERYWVPANASIQMGGLWDDTGGYLADPEDGFLGKHANKHLLTTAALLSRQPGCIVLWGEPGMGKSQTVRSYLPSLRPAPVIAVEFRDIPDAGRFERMTTATPAWHEWRAGNHLLTLVIDGVDEGLIKIAGFVSYLTGLLKECPRERLQLILACRSLEWPDSEGQDLIRLWPALKPPEGRSGIFELCPLREKDVRLAAEHRLAAREKAPAVDKFLRAVRQRQLVGLATRPLTLKMLLHEFGEGAGFSRNHRQLYRRYSHFLGNETNAERERRLRDLGVRRLQVPPKQRERIAGRIASLLLLCGRSAIWTGRPEQAAKSDLTIAEICATSDHAQGLEFAIEPYMVEAVLESPLFWPKGNGRVGFFHQTFADCLAAEYLRALPFPQMRTLLCRQDQHGEFVHPPLAEFAAWLAGESDELLQHLLRHDPETLLRSDVSEIKEGSRAALVDAVLHKAAVGELFDARGLERFFHTLNHPRLAPQLRAVINDRRANRIARRIALRIAERCNLTDLFEDVFARVRDPRDDDVRSLAAATLDDLANPQTAQQLVRYLKAKRTKPLAAGVQLSLAHATLKHGAWTLSEALPHLEAEFPQRDSSNHILTQHAKPADAEALLGGCLRWPGCFDVLSPYRPFVAAAHDLGVARIHEPAIRRLLARVWWRARLQHEHEDFKGVSKDGPALRGLLEQDASLRLGFIADLASLGSTQANDHWWLLDDLCKAEDFPELLRLAQAGPAGPRRVYAHLAARLHDPEAHRAHWGELLASLPRSAELAAAFAWLRLWPLDAPETIAARQQHYEFLQRRAETEQKRQKRKPRPDPVTAWQRDIDYLPRAKPEHWLTVAHNLFCHPEGAKGDQEVRHDIRTSPGWKYHGQPARAAITAAARRFLLEVPGNPQHPVGGQSEFDELAYKAIYQLRDEIKAGGGLAEAVRRHWLPIIFDEFSNADAHHLELMAIGYRLDGGAMRQLLEERMLRDAGRDQGLTLEPREFALCWDQPLADFVVDVAADKIDRAETIRAVMEHLAEHDVAAARKLWRKLQPTRHQNEERYVAALAALLGWRLFELWDDLWPSLDADHKLAERVFLAIDTHDRRNFLNRSEPRSADQLAELYLLLRQLFPPAGDPAVPTDRAYSPTRRMEIGRLRDELLQALVVLGTDAAAAELARIAERVPAEDRLSVRWRWREALVAARRKAWQPPAADVVLRLVEKTNRRWLLDEGDLLALVLESLARLEDNLTKQPNSLRRDFWRVRAGRGPAKYYSPHDEVELSRRIATWLQSDLAPHRGITLQREVQVQWDKRTDLEIRAVAMAGSQLRPLEIVLEVKGCWHPKLNTALRDQLVGDYLQGSGRTHGIYLVVWTKCARWQDPQDSRRVRWKVGTVAAARRKADKLAQPYDGRTTPFVVRAGVLDARL